MAGSAHQPMSPENWQAVETSLEDFLQRARTFTGYDRDEVPGLTLQLRANERVYLSIQGCGLVETRREPGQYQGGYSGFSFPIGHTGIRYRIGGSRGTYVPGPEQPTIVDEGTATITSVRTVFQGPQQSREWAYDKLLGFEHYDSPPWTAVHVSNRQKTSGIAYDQESASEIEFCLGLSIAHYQNDVGHFVEQLEAEQKAHQDVRPAASDESRVTAGASATAGAKKVHWFQRVFRTHQPSGVPGAST